MAVLINKDYNIFLSSDETVGAENVSADGSRFSILLNTPINIPANAFNCTIGVVQANVWFTTPNISILYNNNLLNFTTSDAGNPGNHTITFSDGLYSVSNINAYINTALTNLGLPAGLLNLGSFASTGQTIITFSTAGDSINFAYPGSCNVLLGFDPAVITATIDYDSIYSDTVAKLNRTNSYLISCDLVSSGIAINNKSASLICEVPIDVSPGDQIAYAPNNITEVEADNLIGCYKSNITVQLYDQSLRPAATQGEVYSVLLRIRYNQIIKV